MSSDWTKELLYLKCRNKEEKNYHTHVYYSLGLNFRALVATDLRDTARPGCMFVQSDHVSWDPFLLEIRIPT